MPNYSNSNPGHLLSQARINGDLNDVLDLYRSYVKLLARVQMANRVAGKFDASDIVQEVFFKASRAFAQFRGATEREFLAWLRQILANVLATQMRKFHGATRDCRLEQEFNRQISDASSVLQTAFADESPSPSEKLAQKERAVILAEAIDKLPPDYRDVVVLRHFEQLPFAEIAKRMEKSLNSVRNVWPRALAKLKQNVQSSNGI